MMSINIRSRTRVPVIGIPITGGDTAVNWMAVRISIDVTGTPLLQYKSNCATVSCHAGPIIINSTYARQ